MEYQLTDLSLLELFYDSSACKVLTEKIYLEVQSCYVALACCLLRMPVAVYKLEDKSSLALIKPLRQFGGVLFC